jgi:hypothetical protein
MTVPLDTAYITAENNVPVADEQVIRHCLPESCVRCSRLPAVC